LASDGLQSVPLSSVKIADSIGIPKLSGKSGFPNEAKALKAQVITAKNSNNTLGFRQLTDNEIKTLMQQGIADDVANGTTRLYFKYEAAANADPTETCLNLFVPLPKLRSGEPAQYMTEMDATPEAQGDSARNVLIKALTQADASLWLGLFDKQIAASEAKTTTAVASTTVAGATTKPKTTPARTLSINKWTNVAKEEEKAKIFTAVQPVQFAVGKAVPRISPLHYIQDAAGVAAYDPAQFSPRQQNALRGNDILNTNAFTPSYTMNQTGDGVLQVKLQFHNIAQLKKQARVLLLNLPVRVQLSASERFPAWVEQWNGDTPDKTGALTSFFKSLAGRGSAEYEQRWADSRITELVELRIVIVL
jgi:hypothetical protein